MNEKQINKILNYMKQYVENIYEHDSEPMLNWKDLEILLDYINNLQTRWNSLRNYIKNELESCERLEVSCLSIMELKLLLAKMNELEGNTNETDNM